MRRLLLFVLRVLLQLLLFGITGRWVELGRPEPGDPMPRAPKPARTFTPRPRGPRKEARPTVRDAARAAKATSRAPARSFPEGGAREAEFALEGGPRRASRPRGVQTVHAPKPATSLRAALADRRVLRDALILDAALGARHRKR